MMQTLVNVQASPRAVLGRTGKLVKQWAKLRGKTLRDQQFHAKMSTRLNNLATFGGVFCYWRSRRGSI